MEIFDLPQKDFIPRNEIQAVDRQKHEFKLIGRERKVPGHTLFSLNLKTGEIKAAPVERADALDFKTEAPVHRERVVIEQDCLYRQALNRKNFIRRLVREGILIKRP